MLRVFCLLLVGFFTQPGQARSVVHVLSPLAAEGELKKQSPNAIIVTKKECRISSKGIYTVALISRDKNAKSAKDSLKAHLYYVIDNKKHLIELKEYRKDSSMRQAIGLFWSDDTKSMENFEILCAIPGTKDGIIFDGYAVGAFKGADEYKMPQVCLQTDNMYSNYSCFSYNFKTKKIELSHVQEFAD